MTWHYQITKRTVEGQAWYELREVYEDCPCGERMWTENPVTACGDDKNEVVDVLFRMVKDAMYWDVLDLDEEKK